MGAMLFRNPTSGVADVDGQRVSVVAGDKGDNPVPLNGLDCIGEEVHEDLV